MYIHNWLVLWILPTSPSFFNRKGHLQVAIPEIQEEAAPPPISSEAPWINEIHGMWIWDMLGFFDIPYMNLDLKMLGHGMIIGFTKHDTYGKNWMPSVNQTWQWKMAV